MALDDQHPEGRRAEGVSAFAGAQRAQSYIEDPHTVTADEVRAVRSAGEPTTDSSETGAARAPAHADQVTISSPPPAAAPAATVAPASAPVPAADTLDAPLTDLGTVALTERPVTARRGLRGAFSRIGIRMAPGGAEQAELDQAEVLRRNEEIVRQATWTRAVSVLVANQKGGVGKTPCALSLGGVLAAVRGGSVCVMEVSDDPGALTFRAEGTPALGMGELVRDVGKITSAGQLAGYTAPQTSFASVIGTVGRRPRLTGEDVVSVAAVVDEFYAIRVMDSGNQPSSSAFQGAVEVADALVIPVFNAGDAVLEAVALLDVLRAAGGKAADLANRAIVLRLTDGRPENPQVVSRVDRIIDTAGVAQVFAIPYDPHIAERGQITLGKLAAPTYRAFAAAAAGVVRSLQTSTH